MKIEIFIKNTYFGDFTPRIYNEDEDDVRSILIDICHFVETQVDFEISGFGQDRWPVDTGTDLAVFLEQLPDTIKAIKNKQPTTIDFYEQGVERYLKISRPDSHDMHQISCTSHTNWQPNPNLEKIHTSELLEMLSAAKDTFSRITASLSPNLTIHPWIVEWVNT